MSQIQKKQIADEQTIAELKTKHTDIWLLTDEDGDEYIVRRPTECEVERFLQETTDKKRDKLPSYRVIVESCVLWPDASTMSTVIERYPCVVLTLGNKMMELNKLHDKVRVKKL